MEPKRRACPGVPAPNPRFSFRAAFKKWASVWLPLFLMWAWGGAWAGPPDVSRVQVTDVTPVSFSVVWIAGEPGIPDVALFEDPKGENPLDVPVEIQPASDPVTAEAAQSLGVMKVRVSGLEPGTTYHFRTLTTSLLSHETGLFPPIPSLLSVTTENRVVRALAAGSIEIPFSNDLMVCECVMPSGAPCDLGSLVVVRAEGCTHPISAFVGDGIASPYAYVDLNTVFGLHDRRTLPLFGGELMTTTFLMGAEGEETTTLFVPENHGLSEMKPALSVPLDASGTDEGRTP